MMRKNLLEGQIGPVSQSVDAVKSLLTWKGRAVDPLPLVLEFTHEGKEGRLVLVLSNKRDSYYVTTARACSCPAASYHQGPCQHMKKFFGAEQRSQTDSFRPLPGRQEKVTAIPSMLIDQYDTTDREAAYHSIQADKLLWPMEA